MRKLFVVLLLFAAMSTEAQWVRLTGLPPTQINKVAWYNEYSILAGADDVYKSTDMGQTWSVFYNTEMNGVNALNVFGGKVYVGNNYNNVYSYNDGAVWKNTNLTKYVYCFYNYYSRMLAGTESNRCYYQDYNDSNWVQSSDIWEDVLCFMEAGGKLLAGTSQGIYYSYNSGTNWIQADADGVPFNGFVSNSSELYAGSDFMGVWKSSDYGFIWKRTALSNLSVNALASFRQNVFAGTHQNGFYLSTNNVANWIQRNEGMGSVTINSLAIAGGNIYAATENAGLWKRPLSEMVNTEAPPPVRYPLFELYQNYPNPFNPGTSIVFALSREARVKLSVYDAAGKEIEQVFDKVFQPGNYSTPWDASKYPSGVYYYKLTSGGLSSTKMMVFVK